MSKRIAKHLSPSTAIAFIALIFAITGGAFAAAGNGGSLHGTFIASAAKSKSESKVKVKVGPRGPAGPAGKNGATGATGPPSPAGPAGAKGDPGAAGANGTNGANGSNGKTVLNGTATPTAAVGEVGDFYIKTSTHEVFGPKAASGSNGGWLTGTKMEGSPWTAGGTLPVDSTETGVWGEEELTTGSMEQAVSFPIPLASEPEYIYVSETEGSSPGCPGIIDGAPTAESGKFCVYATLEFVGSGSPTIDAKNPTMSLASGASRVGAILHRSCSCIFTGAWAVTG